MKTETTEYKSGDNTYIVTMTEATNQIAMDRTIAIKEAIKLGEAAMDDPRQSATADKQFVFAAVSPTIVGLEVDGKEIPCPITFQVFMTLPQRLTEVVLPQVNRRLNPQWFVDADKDKDKEGQDQKKVV